MIAEIEKLDHSYENKEMGEPICGEAFCDTCGDCLYCYSNDCDSNDYCGMARWVIYLHDELNPYKNGK